MIMIEILKQRKTNYANIKNFEINNLVTEKQC